MLRVIAGKYGGRGLHTPAGRDTRPITDKVRAAIFSSLGEQVVGAEVLDLYAGSGSLGLEALSRGAERADFVDKSRASALVIVQNAELLGLSKEIKLSCHQAETFLKNTTANYDLIFFDPPYKKFDIRLAEQASNLLKSDGVMVLSCSSKTEFENDRIIAQKRYGDTKITYLKK